MFRPKYGQILEYGHNTAKNPLKIGRINYKPKSPLFLLMKNKKLTILHQLSQESTSIGLFELLKKLGGEYPERSVRRWLSEIVAERLVEKNR